MSSASNLTCRKGVWYFRARVPTEYVSAFGKKMVSISLQTKDEKEARLRAHKHRHDLDLALQDLGRRVREPSSDYKGPLLHLTDQDIAHICGCYRAQVLADDERRRIAGLNSGDELEIDIYRNQLTLLRQAYAQGNFAEVYEGVDRYLRKHGPKLLQGTPAYERLVRAFQLAEIEAQEALLQRRLGTAIGVPSAPRNGETYESVFQRWKDRKSNRNAKTLASFQFAYDLMREHCNALTPALLSRDDGIKLRDALLAKGEMSRATIAKYLGFLQAIFECSVEDGKLSANPFKKIVVNVDEVQRAQKSRMPFERSDLKAIVSSSLYQPGFEPRKGLGVSCFWLPLLGIWTGARLEELCQLHAEDVRFDEESQAWYLDIHAEGSRKVKTLSSIRRVPVHLELVKVGFLDFTASVKTGPLFSMLKADKYGKLGTVWSTWFGRYLDELKITDPRLVFHSFRHTFIQHCKEKVSAIPAEVREAMVGHLSPKAIESIYGQPQYPLLPMVQAMKHIDFGLDLTHLYKPLKTV